MLAPSEVGQQYLAENTVSWVEQYHQVDPDTGEPTELARQWRAERSKAPEHSLVPLRPRPNFVGAKAEVPEKRNGPIIAR
eukprot:12417755-Alexandrium_andersonii.AAC.1